MASKISHGQPTDVALTEDSDKNAASSDEQTTPGVKDEYRNAEEVVKKSWEEIERKCVCSTRSNLVTERCGWKAVRLFVSSTFHDFHSEREILVKKVFPELREWCTDRCLHLIDCDLRWGVPKDSTTAVVLSICMDEIERCHGDTDSQGLFLNMLGERYGWIPSTSDVPPELEEQFKWVHNTSITHMEILLGAMYKHNHNAAFFIRNPSGWLDKLPQNIQDQFIDVSLLGRVHMKELKKRIRDQFPDQCFDYECYVDNPEEVKARPEIKGLDDFGNRVLNFLKKSISRDYPKPKLDDESEPDLRERFCHECVLEQKGAVVLGRDREFDLMLKYGKGEMSHTTLAKCWADIYPDCCSETLDNGSNEDEEKSLDIDRNIIAIIAEPGAGKSSLLAKCVFEARKVKLDVFFHFVGCSGISTCHTNMIKRLCFFLLAAEDPRIKIVIDSEDSNVIQSILDQLLEERKESGKKLLILIDDLSQLSQTDESLSWLLKDSIHPNITLVISMVKGDRVEQDVKNRSSKITWLTLGYLTEVARKEIVEKFFHRYNKALDPEQMSLIVKSEGAKNALWLSLACEELRVFGVFDLVTQYIREMPACLDTLLGQILTRLVKEDETDLLKQTLCFMECSRDGLREEALQLLLGSLEEQKPIPMLHWAMINRTLKPFIRVSSSYQQLKQITFYHHAIGKAVRTQWLAESDTCKKYHRILADYFQYQCTDEHLLAAAVAYHINCSKDGPRLVNFIKNDERSRYVNAIDVSRYIKQNKCSKMVNPKFNFGGHQLFICQFCGMQRGAFSKQHKIWPNQDSCVLCGRMVNQSLKKENNQAYWCGRHLQKQPMYSDHRPTCHICKRSVVVCQRTPLYLCHLCEMGGGFSPICCRLCNE